MNVNFDNKYTYDIVGCDKCNGSGYYDRIAIYEILELNDELKELIINNASTLEIKKKAIEFGYRPFVVDAMDKVLDGETTLDEVNRKLIIF